MKIHSKDFPVPHHKKIDIKRLPTIREAILPVKEGI
jgi:hypothetical protein